MKFFDDVIMQFTFLEIGECNGFSFFGFPKIFLEKSIGNFMNFVKNFSFGLGFFLLFRIFYLVFFYFYAVLFGSMSQRFRIGKSFDFHEESDGSSTFSRGEVLPNLFAGRNHKTRRFFFMKRTQALEISACTF